MVKVERSRRTNGAPSPEFRFATALAKDKVEGRSTVSAQVAAWPADKGRPVAAINGDFFVMTGSYAGDPTGVQIREGELVSLADANGRRSSADTF